MPIDRLSLATVPITTFFNDLLLSEATGFVWKRHDRLYLITNWHVASATDFFTGHLLLKGGSRPNKFRCAFIINVGRYDRELIELPVRDENDDPLWLIHTTQERHSVDIVALPLDGSAFRKQAAVLPINDIAPARLAIGVGMDVFILGYPFGPAPPSFPIWKRGSIASEPDLVKLTGGRYLIDSATRPGMSGAPVILRSWNNHVTESDAFVATTEGPIDQIIGVYSGRKPGSPNPQRSFRWAFSDLPLLQYGSGSRPGTAGLSQDCATLRRSTRLIRRSKAQRKPF